MNLFPSSLINVRRTLSLLQQNNFAVASSVQNYSVDFSCKHFVFAIVKVCTQNVLLLCRIFC